MAAGANVHDAGDATFEREAIERSKTVPVVVDLWAPWCAPCRSLGPILERLAEEHGGAFELVKVNVDESPATARALAVRSIPTVIALRDGRVVSQFEGALPEASVRRFLEAVLPTRADGLVAEGRRFADAGHLDTAESRYREALTLDARHPGALLALAALMGDREDTAPALELLERIGPGLPESEAADRLAAALRTRGAAAGFDEAGLRARLAACDGDLDARVDLGLGLAAAGRHEEALETLLDALRRDPKHRDEAARRAMIDLFALLGADHPLTQRYRSALARALFR
ncbi:MAG: tetratricopeptide repeat protein [Deltaproteobacteria bacterium]|nr:tetratricopeptide repeat protein [Deltaproteobacteria bacterium]